MANLSIVQYPVYGTYDTHIVVQKNTKILSVTTHESHYVIHMLVDFEEVYTTRMIAVRQQGQTMNDLPDAQYIGIYSDQKAFGFLYYIFDCGEITTTGD